MSQDGDLKAFQVLVPKCEEHESRVGGELSKFTKQYREDNATLFEVHSADVDHEDGVFKDALYKTMLAVGLGQNPDTLAEVRPTRSVGT